MAGLNHDISYSVSKIRNALRVGKKKKKKGQRLCASHMKKLASSLCNMKRKKPEEIYKSPRSFRETFLGDIGQ